MGYSKDVTVCPYPDCWNCICRGGAFCGGYNIEKPYPDKCPHFRPVPVKAIGELETKIMNDCYECERHNRQGKENFACDCDKMAALRVLQSMRHRYERKSQQSDSANKKSISGITFLGEGN